jgi:excisionase family DNA binding protein
MTPKSEELLRPRDAATVLGVSYASLKQWIYKGKLRTVKTAGGHHRVPQSELDRFLYKSLGRQPAERRASFRNISGRNQLVGRIVDVRTCASKACWLRSSSPSAGSTSPPSSPLTPPARCA